MRSLRLIIIGVACLLQCTACRTGDRVTRSQPLERMSTGAAVHAAVQTERSTAAMRAIEADRPDEAKALLEAIAAAELEHENEQHQANAAARAEREACERRAADLEEQLQSTTRWWWNAMAIMGGAMFVLGATGAVFLAGVRREAIMLATAGALATGFALGVLAVLPWMRTIALVCIALGVVAGTFALLRQRRISLQLTDTGEAARRLMPSDARNTLFSGTAPLADVLQDSATRAFVHSARKPLPVRSVI